MNGGSLKKPPLMPQMMNSNNNNNSNNHHHQPISVPHAMQRVPMNPKKSISIESIPSSLQPNNNTNKNNVNGHSQQLSHLITSNNTKIENNSSSSKNNTSGSNNDNFPLTNIVNRQRTINRSFRTAVDKSFDNPSTSGK